MCYSDKYCRGPHLLKDIPVRGLMRIAILSIIKQKLVYGSEIHQIVRNKIGLDVPKSIIYILLRRMERNGFIISNWDISGSGPAKRVYRITDMGLEYLNDSIDRLRKVVPIISNIIDIFEKGDRNE